LSRPESTRRWGARESDSNIAANNFAAAIQVMRDPEKALGRLPSRPAGARPRGHFGVLRRRHAVADAPADRAGVIDAIAAKWRLEPDAEITLEANPTSVEAGRFRGYLAAGVNRLSIGGAGAQRRRPQGAKATPMNR